PEHRGGAVRRGRAPRNAVDGPRAGHERGRRGGHDRREGGGRACGRRRRVAFRRDAPADAGPDRRPDPMKEPTPFRPVSYLEWNAARRGASTALWEAGATISFEELLDHVRRFERLIAARGVEAGDVVGVQLPNIWQYVALELAIPDLGAVILPLSGGLGRHEVEWITEKTRPRMVIGSAEAAEITSASG